MKIYSDSRLENLIPVEEAVSFGIVPVGETKRITIYLSNDFTPKKTGLLQNISVSTVCFDPESEQIINSEKVLIIEAPVILEPFAVAPIVLEWTPNIDLEQGLKAKFIITAQKIIG